MRSARDLAGELAGRGLPVLGGAASPAVRLTSEQLLVELATHPQARMRLAMIALLLVQPELAGAVPAAAEHAALLGTAAVDRFRFGYQAAVYLQRIWRTMVGVYGGRDPEHTPWLPDLFGGRWNLPRPAELHGETGLRALAELERRLYQPGCDVAGTYAHAVEMLRVLWLGRRTAHGV